LVCWLLEYPFFIHCCFLEWIHSGRIIWLNVGVASPIGSIWIPVCCMHLCVILPAFLVRNTLQFCIFIFTSAKDVMWLVLFVILSFYLCLSVCLSVWLSFGCLAICLAVFEQDYWKKVMSWFHRNLVLWFGLPIETLVNFWWYYSPRYGFWITFPFSLPLQNGGF